jgi:hypothetical protein
MKYHPPLPNPTTILTPAPNDTIVLLPLELISSIHHYSLSFLLSSLSNHASVIEHDCTRWQAHAALLDPTRGLGNRNY